MTPMDVERGNLSRRGFLQRSLGGLAAAGLPLWFAKDMLAETEQDKAKLNQPPGPNDRINMGLIGCGGQGRGDMNAARNQPGVQFVAVCDVDRANRQQAAAAFGPNAQIAQYNDFRELLARQDIDAVIIGTPDHWHALVALEAMRRGKDVYCEKPLTLTVDEGKALVRVARDTNKRLQTGSQQRSEFNGRFRLACELVRNGRIGRIQSIECRIGDNPRGGPFMAAAAPDGLDWNFWKGPTPDVPYVREKCHYTFRWWYEYSGGKMTDWGAHHLDIAQWALDKDGSGPDEVEAEVEAADNRPLCYNCHPHFTVTYRYGTGNNAIPVRAMSRGENGVRFNGEDGKWIFVSRGALTASQAALITEPLPSNAVRLPISTNHMGNFLACCRSRQQPICHVEIGHRSCSVCHIGNIAARTNQRLRWNPTTERFLDNEDANRWLSREMRAPWRLDP
jgi:predicted dehydrogenase